MGLALEGKPDGLQAGRDEPDDDANLEQLLSAIEACQMALLMILTAMLPGGERSPRLPILEYRASAAMGARRALKVDDYRSTEAMVRRVIQLEGRAKGDESRDRRTRGEVAKRFLEAGAKADGRAYLDTTPFPPHVIQLLSLSPLSPFNNRHHVTKPCSFG